MPALCGAEDQAQGFMHAQQPSYQLSYICSPKINILSLYSKWGLQKPQAKRGYCKWVQSLVIFDSSVKKGKQNIALIIQLKEQKFTENLKEEY